VTTKETAVGLGQLGITKLWRFDFERLLENGTIVRTDDDRYYTPQDAGGKDK